MAAKLRYAICNCTEMDADFKLTDKEVAGWGGDGAGGAPINAAASAATTGAAPSMTSA